MPEIGASLINPDAGSHPVTSDPREIGAAVAAGERAYRELPYFPARYGERGRGFGHSDGAWLSLIAAREQPQVNAEVRWLGELLAARGMPQWLMEQYLEFLYHELVAAAPENGAQYARLLNAAEMLRDQRRAQIRESDFIELSEAFDRAAPREWVERLPEMGRLLVSAVADEAAGIAMAVSRLEEWATDPARFPVEWVAAVRETITAARASVMRL